MQKEVNTRKRDRIFSKIILFLGLFLLTLTSHSIYSWTIGLGLIIAYSIIEGISVSKKAVKITFILVFLLILSILRFQIVIIGNTIPLFIEAFWGNLSKYGICIITWLLIKSIIDSTKKDSLLNLVTIILKVHVSAFYIQFIVFIVTGNYIDLLEPFTGEASRYQSFTSSLSFIGSVRPTGFYVEPSTYFYAILALSSIIIIQKKTKDHKALISLTIVSMFLSFSTAAVIIGSLFAIYLFYISRLRLRYYLVVFSALILVSLIFSEQINVLYTVQTLKYENTSGIRFALVDQLINRDISNALMASGAFSIDKNISSLVEKAEIVTNNDNGVFVYLWLIFGYLGIVFYIILFVWAFRNGAINSVLFLLVSMSKIPVFTPLFIIFFCVLVSVNSKIIR